VPQRSPFDYDVSVSADKRRRTRRRGMSGAFEARGRRCDRKGCDAIGQYRAPRSPERLDEYWWFCLDHVREYNQAWNYFDNWTEDDFAAFVESDRLWGRPTWRFGKPGAPDAAGAGHAEGRAWARFGFEDPFEVLGENATLNPGRDGERVPPLRGRRRGSRPPSGGRWTRSECPRAAPAPRCASAIARS